MTTNVDIKNREIAYKYLLSISECVAKRLRKEKMYTQCINVHIKDNNFQVISHQRKLNNKISNTNEIYIIVKELFDEIWEGQSIRSFGVRLDKLSKEEDNQLSFFVQENKVKNKKLDEIIDKTRNKFGNDTIKRAVFLNDDIDPILNNKN
jgi:DNA polymerase-4